MCPTFSWSKLATCHTPSGCTADMRKKRMIAHILNVSNFGSFSQKKLILRMDMVQISKEFKRLLQERRPMMTGCSFSAMEVNEVVFTHRNLKEQTRLRHRQEGYNLSFVP